jgi:hypothetical protein
VNRSYTAACTAILLLIGATAANAAPTSFPAPSDEDEGRAAAYCEQTGGVVETRIPFYGTNNPNPLRLAGSRRFCQYTAPDSSRIHVLLTTLYARQPTLAALAYYARVPLGTCNGNPASCYCTLLGGSDQFGGTSLAGGGWVLPGSIDETLEACIFPDMSSIDSWGLAYHSAKIIRGRNLATVLRFKNPYR